MPNFDRSGPRGLGSMTGRGLGPCGRGLGFRRGFGRGNGWRNCNRVPITITKEEEKTMLEAELKEIEVDKQEVEKRLKELK